MAEGQTRVDHLLLGHTKMDSTVRDLGAELDDTLTLSESTTSDSSCPERNASAGPFPSLTFKNSLRFGFLEGDGGIHSGRVGV